MAEFIQSTVIAAEKAGTFVAAEAPIVIEQLLRWKLTESFMGIICGLIFLITSVFLFKFAKNGFIGKYKTSSDDDAAYAVNLIGCLISAAMSIFTLYFTVGTCMKILIAPKLYLLEYAAELIK